MGAAPKERSLSGLSRFKLITYGSLLILALSLKVLPMNAVNSGMCNAELKLRLAKILAGRCLLVAAFDHARLMLVILSRRT
jgi:hypothetical protein